MCKYNKLFIITRGQPVCNVLYVYAPYRPTFPKVGQVNAQIACTRDT